MANILVTGAAGFIGFHLSQNLINRGDKVVGIDNLNPYYDVLLKKNRLARLEEKQNFRFYKLDLADTDGIAKLFAEEQFDIAVNLAAQAGVRYSIENPQAYTNSNLLGFANILEGCRNTHVKHLVFASSSSVYGANTKVPFSVDDNVDKPVSYYAATKKANELMAYSYSHLYSLPMTGLRFFTVYGPWGRPDMALFLFTQSILKNRPIMVFNHGQMRRDFTYIDDVIEGIIRVMDKIPEGPNLPSKEMEICSSQVPYRVYNIGNHQPVELLYLIEILEKYLGKKAIKNMLPLQPGDVLTTYANVENLVQDTGFSPSTSIEVGVEKFVDWYRSYFRV
jgi:UDP-glucuronate 4-epimerase